MSMHQFILWLVLSRMLDRHTVQIPQTALCCAWDPTVRFCSCHTANYDVPTGYRSWSPGETTMEISDK